ncbi:MAG TPA: TonB-dependent receptor, partial [Terriglobia bacterium]|nr:TonB-dependent receptor [Terriglobia bacterium]
MRGKVAGLCTVVLLAAWFTAGSAQVTTGTISGTVTDSTGAVLPGARIEILNEGTGAVRVVTTDSRGHYLAPSLAVGTYRVAASLEGFQTEVRTGVVLTVGREAVLDIHLQVGQVSQSVEVTGEAPLVQTTESTVSYIVEDRTMRELPLNGRDMTQLILLNPGVNLSVNSPADTAFSGYGKRVSISGMRGEDNIYLLDGGLIGDFRRHIPAGPSGALLGLETVQEFQVLTNSFSAQYGRALGGVFNAVSKSGTNELQGSAYDYFRNDILDAAKWEDNRAGEEKPPFRRNQFGGTIGGPIRRDKSFFFLAYESTREVLGTTQTAVTMDANLRRGLRADGQPILVSGQPLQVNPIMRPYADQYPLPNSPTGLRIDSSTGGGIGDFVYSFKQPTTEHFGQARWDLPSLTANDSFFVRFSASNSDRTSPDVFPDFVQVSSLGSWLLTLSETHIVSPATLNTARFHFNRVVPRDTGDHPPAAPGVTVVPGQSAPPSVNPGSGIATFGGAGFATDPTYMISNRFTVQDDVNWTLGDHALAFGGMLERLQFNGSFPNRGYGVWTFSNVTNFLQGIVQTYRGAIPGYGTYERGFRSWTFALYLQDNWRLTPQLTLNLGLRWEPNTVPTEVAGRIANLRHKTDTQASVGSPYWKNNSWNEFSPRVGFAWSPLASNRTSVRGGAALLYEPNDPNLYYTQMVRCPPLGYDFTFTIPSNRPDLQRFPNAAAQITAITTALNTQSPAYALPFDNMRSPHAIQYNINIQHQLSANDMISLGYTGNRGINLLSVADINAPNAQFNGLSLEFPANATLVNPAWSSIVLYANDTNSWYNGLLASYQRRFSGGFQGQVSFTWSKAIAETDSGQTAGAVTTGGGRMKYPQDHHVQKALSGYDFRRVLTFNYSYELPWGRGRSGWLGKLLSGWQTSGVITLRDGQPQSVTASASTFLSGIVAGPRNPNLKPEYVGKNVVLGEPEKYFDTNAYAAPGTRELGNVGRNTLIGPGAVTWNPALRKQTALTEETSLEFRAEFFNVLNRPNFAAPASNVFGGTGNPIATAGRIT